MIKVKRPEIHDKEWGREEWLTNNHKYCGKFLIIERDKFCSFHYHKRKSEHFHVAQGSILLDYQEAGAFNSGIQFLGKREHITLYEGDTVEIPPYMVHRFTGLDDRNVLIEVSTQHFEGDSYRLEPSYPGE